MDDVVGRQISHDAAWEEDWHPRVEIPLSDIVAKGLHPNSMLRRNTGSLVVILADDTIFVQPIIGNLKQIHFG